MHIVCSSESALYDQHRTACIKNKTNFCSAKWRFTKHVKTIHKVVNRHYNTHSTYCCAILYNEQKKNKEMCAIYAVHYAHIWCSIPYHQHRTACITSTTPCTRYVNVLQSTQNWQSCVHYMDYTMGMSRYSKFSAQNWKSCVHRMDYTMCTSCYSKFYNEHRTDRAACITWTTLCACPVIKSSIISTELTKLRALHRRHYVHVLLFKVV